MPVANSSQKLLYLEKNSSSVFAVRLKVKVIFRSSILGLEDRTRLPCSNRDLFSMNSLKAVVSLRRKEMMYPYLYPKLYSSLSHLCKTLPMPFYLSITEVLSLLISTGQFRMFISLITA